MVGGASIFTIHVCAFNKPLLRGTQHSSTWHVWFRWCHHLPHHVSQKTQSYPPPFPLPSPNQSGRFLVSGIFSVSPFDNCHHLSGSSSRLPPSISSPLCPTQLSLVTHMPFARTKGAVLSMTHRPFFCFLFHSTPHHPYLPPLWHLMPQPCCPSSSPSTPPSLTWNLPHHFHPAISSQEPAQVSSSL